MISRIIDFVRMNPPIFLGSMVGEDPQEFLNEVYKVLSAMGVAFREKVELDSYQSREVAQVWYTLWKDYRSIEPGPIEWQELKEAFIGKYFAPERRDVMVEEFTNLKQGNMSV